MSWRYVLRDRFELSAPELVSVTYASASGWGMAV